MSTTKPVYISLLSSVLCVLGLGLLGCGSAITPGSIAITADSRTVAAGTYTQLHAIDTNVVQRSTDVTNMVTWRSSNPAVATVSATGVLTGISSGTTTISASLNTDHGSMSSTILPPAITGLKLTPVNTAVVTHGTQQYTATANYTTNTTGNASSVVEWVVTPASVASISPTGLLSANAPGSFTVTATSGSQTAVAGGIVADATLASLTITPANSSIAGNAKQQFTATGTFTDQTTTDLSKNVTWTSSDTSRLTIDANGLGTAHGSAATATVTVTAQLTNITATAPVQVTPAGVPTALYVLPTSSSIAKGSAEPHTAIAVYSDGTQQDVSSAVTWSVVPVPANAFRTSTLKAQASTSQFHAAADTAPVVTVAQDGTDTAVTPGMTMVQAGLAALRSQSVVIVTPATVTSLAIRATKDLFPVGSTQPIQLIGQFSDGSSQDLTLSANWQSSDPTIATIDSKGKATGLKAGNIQFTASFGGQSAATIGFQVLPSNLVSTVISVPHPAAPTGDSQQLSLIGTYSDGTTHDLTALATWQSSAPSTYSVDAHGVVFSVSPGVAQITGTVAGRSAILDLAALDSPLLSISILPANPAFVIGTTSKLRAIGTFGGGVVSDISAAVIWRSNDPSVLTINTAGYAKGGSLGSTAVTATLLGVTGTSAPVQVRQATLSSLNVTPRKSQLAALTGQQYKAVGRFSDGTFEEVTQDVVWDTTDNTVASIDATGYGIGMKPGQTHVTATFMGQTVALPLTVTGAKLSSVAITPGNPEMPAGIFRQFSVVGTFTDGTVQDLTQESVWLSPTPAIAINLNKGQVLGTSPGVGAISAQHGYFSATTPVNVTLASLTGMTIAPASTTIRAGGQQKLTVTGTFDDGFSQDLYLNAFYSSDDLHVANFLTDDGVIYGTGVGNATISVALRGMTASTGSFRVDSGTVSALAITPASPSIAPGQAQQLIATATYADGTTADVSGTAQWSSSSPSILTVDENGLASAAGGTPSPAAISVPAGTSAPMSVSVTAKVDGVTASANVSVLPASSGNTPPAFVTVTPTSLSFAKGMTQQFTVTGTYADGTTRDLTGTAAFTTSDARVVSVSAMGLALGVGVGSVQISVTVAGVTGTTGTLTVTPATVVALAVKPTSAHVAAGTPTELIATATYTDGSINDLSGTVTWSSDNSSVANIGNTGLVTGITAGLANIQAQLGSLTGTAAVRVGNATLTSVAISPSGSSFPAGTTQQFTLTGTFSDGSTQNLSAFATWSTSAPAVASVSASGLVTGVAAGSVQFTASYNNQTATTPAVQITPATLVSIAVTPSSPTFPKGIGQKLTVTGTYSDGTTHDLTGIASFTSSNPAVVAISSNGLAMGLSTGTSVITVSAGGKTASTQTVTVTGATLVSISLVPATPHFAAGTTQQFTATGTFSDGTTIDLGSQATWLSSNPQVLTIDASGLASGMQPGTVQVSATLMGITATTGTAQVTSATLTNLTLSPTTSRIAKGTTGKFTVTGTFSDGSTQDLSTQAAWSSSDGTVVSIDANGLATGIAPGSAQLTATFEGMTVTTSSFAVSNATLVSIAFNPANPTVTPGTNTPVTVTGTFSDGSTQDLSGSATYTSSNPAVVTVSSTGVLTAVAPGTSTITVTANGVSSSFTVTVSNSAATLQQITVAPAPGATPHTVRAHGLQASAVSLAPGTSKQYAATGVYSDQSTRNLTTQVTWSSSAPSIATVSSTGLVSFVSPGSANIQASLGSVSGTAPLTVSTSAVTLQAVTITPSTASVPRGSTQQFTALGTYSDGSTRNLTTQVAWQSSAPGIVSIDSNGLATSLAGGNAQISATFQGQSFTASLTVSPAALTSLAVTPASTTLANGTSQQYKAMGTLTDGSTLDLTTSVIWSTSGPSASINAAGLATGTSLGQATVTAQSGSLSATATLQVTSATPVSVQLSPSSVSLPAGAAQQLLATATFSDGTSQNVTSSVTYVSSNANLTTVDARGVLKSLAPGSATVTATLGSASVTIPVTVSTAALTSLAVTPSPLTLAAGVSQQLTATGTYTDGSTQDLTNSVAWTTSNAQVATVSATGNVTAAQAGNATITATSGSTTATVSVTATTATATAISVSPASTTLVAGQTQQFTATATLTDGTQQNVTASAHWSVSDPSKGTISNTAGTNGFLTSTAAGAVNVVATLNSTSGTAAVTIQSGTLLTLTISPNPASVPAGTTLPLTATGHYSDGSTANLNASVTWISANSSIAAVDATGLVHGITPGTTAVTATLNGVFATAPVTVTSSPLNSIAIAPATLSLALGQHAQLTATGTYADGSTQDITTQVNWTSSAPAVGTVSTSGLVSTAGTGSSTVTATLNGVSRQLPLTVTAATLQSISVQAAQTSFALGQSVQLRAIGTYTDGTTQDITSTVLWSSQTPAVGVVNSAGLATGVTAGTFNAMARLGGVSGTLPLTITNAILQSIAISPANTVLVSALGAQVQFTATGTYSDGSTQNITGSVHWAVTSGVAVGSISQSGRFSATGVGVGTISATSGTISGSTTVTIVSLI